MSIIPISTNFIGISRNLIPKCQVCDIYNLECVTYVKEFVLSNDSIHKIQTLCVLAGGSIITNIKILSQLPVITGIENYYLSIMCNSDKNTSEEYGSFIVQVPLFDSNKTYLFNLVGSTLPTNGQICCIYGPNFDNPNLNPKPTIAHVQILIEYLAENNS